jgi:hypothetical protein
MSYFFTYSPTSIRLALAKKQRHRETCIAPLLPAADSTELPSHFSTKKFVLIAGVYWAKIDLLLKPLSKLSILIKREQHGILKPL